MTSQCERTPRGADFGRASRGCLPSSWPSQGSSQSMARPWKPPARMTRGLPCPPVPSLCGPLGGVCSSLPPLFSAYLPGHLRQMAWPSGPRHGLPTPAFLKPRAGSLLPPRGPRPWTRATFPAVPWPQPAAGPFLGDGAPQGRRGPQKGKAAWQLGALSGLGQKCIPGLSPPSERGPRASPAP